MGRTVYKINGKQIKSPPIPGDIEKYNLTYAERTTDGNMKMDLIAKKVKLVLRYPVISQEEYKIIENEIFSSNLFFQVEYPDGPEQKTMTAYTGAIKKNPAWHDHGYWYWKDLELNLIEQ